MNGGKSVRITSGSESRWTRKSSTIEIEPLAFFQAAPTLPR
jgi:hypothetical protein